MTHLPRASSLPAFPPSPFPCAHPSRSKCKLTGLGYSAEIFICSRLEVRQQDTRRPGTVTHTQAPAPPKPACKVQAALHIPTQRLPAPLSPPGGPGEGGQTTADVSATSLSPLRPSRGQVGPVCPSPMVRMVAGLGRSRVRAQELRRVGVQGDAGHPGSTGTLGQSRLGLPPAIPGQRQGLGRGRSSGCSRAWTGAGLVT